MITAIIKTGTEQLNDVLKNQKIAFMRDGQNENCTRGVFKSYYYR